jgi:acetyl esterase/lipase
MESSEDKRGPRASSEPGRGNGRNANRLPGERRAADLILRGRAGVVPVRVRWPAATRTGAPPPVIVLLPDLAPRGGVDPADDALADELCSRVEAIVLCVPWARARDGAPDSALERASVALEWSADHADELGGDPRHLILAGRGVGAAAVAALAVRARDRGWPPIVRQVLILADARDRSEARTEAFAALAPPIRSLRGAATATLVTGDRRPSARQPSDCGQRLRAAGLEVEELAAHARGDGSDAPTRCGLPEPLLADLAGALRRALSRSTETTVDDQREGTR